MENLLTENILLNIGGCGLATLALFVIFFFVKSFRKTISEFLKVLQNHLDHMTKMQEKDIKSRDEYTARFTEMIVEIRNYFKK